MTYELIEMVQYGHVYGKCVATLNDNLHEPRLNISSLADSVAAVDDATLSPCPRNVIPAAN